MTPALDTALVSWAASDADVLALLAASGQLRWWPDVLMQGSGLPAVVAQRIDSVRDYDLDGDTQAPRQRVQLAIYGPTRASCRQVRDLLVAELSGYAGYLGGAHLSDTVIALDLDDYDPDTRQYRTILDIQSTINEEV